MSEWEDSLSKLRDETVFFVDRSIQNPLVVQAFLNSNCKVELHNSIFNPNTLDEVWIKHVADNNLIAVTKDKAIIRRHLAIQYVKIYKIGMFVLAHGDMSANKQFDIFTEIIPRLLHYIKNNKKPFIVKIQEKVRTRKTKTGNYTSHRKIDLIKLVI